MAMAMIVVGGNKILKVQGMVVAGVMMLGDGGGDIRDGDGDYDYDGGKECSDDAQKVGEDVIKYWLCMKEAVWGTWRQGVKSISCKSQHRYQVINFTRQ